MKKARLPQQKVLKTRTPANKKPVISGSRKRANQAPICFDTRAAMIKVDYLFLYNGLCDR
jgi:hypothetical protein